MSERIECRRVVLAGRVQGVGFRAWTVREATARGLSGYVRNRRDGSVEAVFAGSGAQVDAMIEACRNGPPGSQVASLSVHTTDEPVAVGQPFRTLGTV